jgi:hypothetical protein
MFTRPSCSSHTTPSTQRDMTTVYKMGHTITVGLSMLRVQRQNPPAGSELSRATRERERQSDTRGGHQLVDLEPRRGDPTSSSFVSKF